MRPFNLLLVFLTIALLGGGCASTVPPPEGGWIEVLDGTTRVSCHGADLEGPLGPRLARSDVYVSPDGSRRAWVEVEARALVDGDDGGTCQNISRLYVADASRIEVAFTQRPGWEGRNGNALEIVDWSSDGTQIIMELFTWTYPTDPARPLVLVWDARTSQTRQIDARVAVAARLSQGCAFELRGRGFTDAGLPVLEVSSPTDDPCAGSMRHVVARENGATIEPLSGTPPAHRARREPPGSATLVR
jgi:hypothetical protein